MKSIKQLCARTETHQAIWGVLSETHQAIWGALSEISQADLGRAQ